MPKTYSRKFVRPLSSDSEPPSSDADEESTTSTPSTSFISNESVIPAPGHFNQSFQQLSERRSEARDSPEKFRGRQTEYRESQRKLSETKSEVRKKKPKLKGIQSAEVRKSPRKLRETQSEVRKSPQKRQKAIPHKVKSKKSGTSKDHTRNTQDRAHNEPEVSKDPTPNRPSSPNRPSTSKDDTRNRPGTSKDSTRNRPGTSKDSTPKRPGISKEPTAYSPGISKDPKPYRPSTSKDLTPNTRSTSKKLSRSLVGNKDAERDMYLRRSEQDPPEDFQRYQSSAGPSGINRRIKDKSSKHHRDSSEETSPIRRGDQLEDSQRPLSSAGPSRTPSTGLTAPLVGSKKRKPPIPRAISEIRRLQASTNLLLLKLPFARVVREITAARKPGFRWQVLALEALQEGAEIFLVHLFEDSLLCSLHRCRVTLNVNDMRLAYRLRTRSALY